MAIVTPLISSVFIIFFSISNLNSGDIPRGKWLPARGIRFVSGAAPSARRTPVTYGSVSEMIHKPTGYKLSSGRISWGSGSGNQAVTAVSEAFSRSSLWVIKEGYGLPPIGAGEVVNCSSVIRLEHVLSERNLHAVRLKSPISPNYEVRLTHPVPPILAVEFNSLLIVQRATQRPPHRVVLLFSPTTYR
eukprot:GHVN01042088.1.p1 GENE.GHVN01042088.1~~GHVN01042088.1.p1  ORF type:complete len:189 (+),score=20.68 GHVN01042088.1:192-758(+)